ncbi:MAG: peroxidase family protein [Thermomicrobiales bacterium]
MATKRDAKIGQNGKTPRKSPGWGASLLPLAAVVVALAWWRRERASAGGVPANPLLPLVTLVDRTVGWHRLPWPLGLPVIFALMGQLRRENLFDPSTMTPSLPRPPLTPPGASHLTTRTADGTFNDLARPEMGSIETRFGRNVPLSYTAQEPDAALLSPSPRTVSRELMTRHEFRPAETLNVFTAAWIQFMVRDWFSHGAGSWPNRWQVPLDADDPWPGPERTMGIARTRADPTRPADHAGTPLTFTNTETHWWDASQIYGSSEDYQRLVRSGVDGKLRVDEHDLPQIDPLLPLHPAAVPGFWLGMAMLGILFIREHNAICDRLRAVYPRWSDEELFQHARLINAALMAKIHTVEWTTALLDHPTMIRALRADWWGLAGERVSRLIGRIGDGEIISGVLGSQTEHFGAPYAITEEFVAVYRMHPLIPDDYAFRAAADHRLLLERDFDGVAQWNAIDVLNQAPLSDLFYSFGVAHPGAISLHNFPKGLQEFKRPDGNLQDLAATDILRTRELGVPRYNAFRELLHLPRVESFEKLTDNPTWAEELRRVYDGDIDRVDLMAGMFAEPSPPGFAFSETAFRIFVLMAPRRLKSDRFFTNDFTARVYSQTGLDWIADNTFGTIVGRHFPELRPALRGVENAFKPWNSAA